MSWPARFVFSWTLLAGYVFALNQYAWLRGLTDNRHTPGADGRHSLFDLAAAMAILESAAARRTVSLQEVLSSKVDTYQRPIDAHHGLLP